MTITGEDLYTLLPGALRTADQAAGGMVQALLEVLAEQLDAVDADIEQMGEDWFIETCAAWVVPYVGELLGEHLVAEVEGLATPRARIANTIGYRRRKGTIAVLEALTRDSTGWPARAVEYYRELATDQHLADVRLDRPARISLRDGDALELIGGAFDSAPHTVDVRHIAAAARSGRARHNIPSIGLHVYRLGAQWVPRATPAPAADPSDGRYRFDPLGRDLPLFNRAAPETEIEHLATEPDVPAPLRRRPLHAELEQRRTDVGAGREPSPRWFGVRPPVRVHRRVAAGDELLEVPPEQLEVCHLGDIGTDWRRPATGRVSIDPVLGRVAFPAGTVPAEVQVSAAHGFAGDLGAGPYDRSAALAERLGRTVTWHVGVSRDVEPAPNVMFPTLGEAIGAWNAQPDGTVGLIAVMESHRFDEDLTGANRVTVGEGSSLAIVAADWPALPVPGGAPGELARRTGTIRPAAVRPALLRTLEVVGTAPDDSPAAGEVLIDGLLIAGGVLVSTSGARDLGRLTVAHCTLGPAAGGVQVNGTNEQLAIEISRCVTGRVRLNAAVPSLTIADSIVDAAGAPRAIDAAGAATALDRVTVLGRARVRELEASDCIFTERVTATRTQVGCVRFSAIAPGSVTPRRHRCETAARPSFTSQDPAHPGYGQLGRTCPAAIAAGASDGSEMGAFSFLRAPQRTANLLAGLDDYLRFGLEAALIPET